MPILSLEGKERATQGIEKAVSFTSLKESIIKPCCINFWILFPGHRICTSTVSVLLKSSFHHWCLLSIHHTMTHCTEHSKDYFSKMIIVTKSYNSDTEFQVLLAVAKCACCSWMHSNQCPVDLGYWFLTVTRIVLKVVSFPEGLSFPGNFLALV